MRRFRLRPRQNPARPLRIEPLEDRAVPATLYADDSLVAGATLGALGGRLALDRDASGTLTPGDQVVFASGETGQVAALTFGQAPVAGDVGSVYTTIQAAVDAAAAGDTVRVAAGTYAETVTLARSVTLAGATGTAADVVIDPALGPGIAIAADNVIVADLRVTGATDGIAGAGVSGTTLTDVRSDANTANGVNLTALTGTTTLTDVTAAGNGAVGLLLTGAAGSTLTLAGVTADANAVANLVADGFATYNLTGLVLTGAAGTASNTINAATAAGSTVNVTAGAGNDVITIGDGTLQLTLGATASQSIVLANVSTLNSNGGGGADTFVITPTTTGGTAVTVNGGTPRSSGTTATCSTST